MPPTETITAFTAIIVAIWAIVMARNPREWRQRWCAMFGLTDLDTTREQRRWQERRLRVAAVAVGVLSLGVAIFSGSIAAWTLKRRVEATRMLQSGSTGPVVRLSVGVPRR